MSIDRPFEQPEPDIISVADLGYRVWLRRRELGMTQAKAAAHCGVGVRFISDLENGKSTIESGRMLRVLSALGLVVKVHQIQQHSSDDA